MVKPIDWISEAPPSMDCPAAPFIDDLEDYFSTRRERLAEIYPPISESGLHVHGPLLNFALRD